MRLQRGAALILVLMVTGILGLLLLQIGLTAKSYVAQANALQERAEASLRLHSRESAMIFTLLTNPWVKDPEARNDSPYLALLNFRGDPFEVDGARFRIQDESGLIPVPQPGQAVEEWAALLQEFGWVAPQVARFAEQFRALQEPKGGDKSAWAPIQSFGELRDLDGMSAAALQRLEQCSTLYPVLVFNPLTAPPEVLAVKYRGVSRDAVLDLRARGELSLKSLYDLTGQGVDEFTAGYPGPALRLDIAVKVGSVALRRETRVVIEPYADLPLRVWESHPRNGAEGWQ
jgi:hypothetical protein